MSDVRRRFVVAGAIAAGALAVVAGRILVDSRAALQAGRQAQEKGDGASATRHYLDAARLYVPGSPFVARALDALQAQAQAAESTGNLEAARRALEAIRAAALGTRSFYTPHADRLAAADQRLARIYAKTESDAVDPGASQEVRAAWHAERLARRPGPATLPVLVVFLGLALWLGAAVAFFMKGLDANLHLRRGPAVASGVAFLIGFTLFLVGLRIA